MSNLFSNITPAGFFNTLIGGAGNLLAANQLTKAGQNFITNTPPVNIVSNFGQVATDQTGRNLVAGFSPEQEAERTRLLAASAPFESELQKRPDFAADLSRERAGFDRRKQEAIDSAISTLRSQGRLGTEAGARELATLRERFEEQEQIMEKNVKQRHFEERRQLFEDVRFGVNARRDLRGEVQDAAKLSLDAQRLNLDRFREPLSIDKTKADATANFFDNLTRSGQLGQGIANLLGGTTPQQSAFNLSSNILAANPANVAGGGSIIPGAPIGASLRAGGLSGGLVGGTSTGTGITGGPGSLPFLQQQNLANQPQTVGQTLSNFFGGGGQTTQSSASNLAGQTQSGTITNPFSGITKGIKNFFGGGSASKAPGVGTALGPPSVLPGVLQGAAGAALAGAGGVGGVNAIAGLAAGGGIPHVAAAIAAMKILGSLSSGPLTPEQVAENAAACVRGIARGISTPVGKNQDGIARNLSQTAKLTGMLVTLSKTGFNVNPQFLIDKGVTPNVAALIRDPLFANMQQTSIAGGWNARHAGPGSGGGGVYAGDEAAAQTPQFAAVLRALQADGNTGIGQLIAAHKALLQNTANKAQFAANLNRGPGGVR